MEELRRQFEETLVHLQDKIEELGDQFLGPGSLKLYIRIKGIGNKSWLLNEHGDKLYKRLKSENILR